MLQQISNTTRTRRRFFSFKLFTLTKYIYKYNLGSDFKDPRRTVEAKLLKEFCPDCSMNEINCNSGDKSDIKFTSFIHPYVSTSHDHHKDYYESRKNGIAQDDIITLHNRRAKNKYPSEGVKKLYDNTPRTFFTVPFNGDSSVYQADYKSPKEQCDFLTAVQTVQE